MNGIDLAPLLQQIIGLAVEFLGLVGAGIAAVAAAKVSSYFHLKNEAQLRDFLDSAVANGIAWARAKADEEAALHGELVTRDQVVSDAGNYVVQHATDAVTGLKVTTDQLAKKIVSKIQQQATS